MSQPIDRPPANVVSTWIEEARTGNRTAIADMLPAVYAELRRVADAYLRRERAGGSLEAAGLVHEAFLRLVGERHVSWQNRAHFCAIAAQAMREVLIERARARAAAKRGGRLERITLVDHLAVTDPQPFDVQALDEALSRFAALDPVRARIVELRYFGGLTIEETAEVLGLSPATVKRGWVLARAWLRRELQSGA